MVAGRGNGDTLFEGIKVSVLFELLTELATSFFEEFYVGFAIGFHFISEIEDVDVVVGYFLETPCFRFVYVLQKRENLSLTFELLGPK